VTANEDIKKFKTIFRCIDKDNKVCYVTVDCYGPNIPENTLDNERMLIAICQAEFARLNVTPLKVEGLDHE
jgi:hypothetical protein